MNCNSPRGNGLVLPEPYGGFPCCGSVQNPTAPVREERHSYCSYIVIQCVQNTWDLCLQQLEEWVRGASAALAEIFFTRWINTLSKKERQTDGQIDSYPKMIDRYIDR